MRKLTGRFILSAIFCFCCSFAEAHEPHDDIYEVEISPEYSKDQTLYIIVRRDLLRSKDGGDTWHRLFKGLDYDGYLESLVIAPSDKNVLYVSALGGGVFRSNDAGNSWVRVGGSIAELDIDEILVSPHSEDIVICGARSGGVYITHTGGNEWIKILPDDIRAASFAFFPDGKDHILVGSDSGVLYESFDAGKEWNEIFSSDYSGAINTIAVSPSFAENKKFYFGTEGGGFYFTRNGGKSFGKKERDSMSVKNIQDIQFLSSEKGREELVLSTWHDGVFASPNDGWYWFERSKGLTRDPQADHPSHLSMLGEQGGGEHRRPHFEDVRVSDGFAKDKTIFVGGFDGIFKSTDGGWNWKELDPYSRSVVGVAVSPNYLKDLTIAVATYADGVYLSNDAGKTWSTLPQELKYIRDKTSYYLKGASREHYLELLWPRFYDIKFSPDYTRDGVIYIMPLHLQTKIFKYSKAGIREILLPVPCSGGAVAFSPDFTESGIMYLASQNGKIYRSEDRGESFEYITRVPVGGRHNSVCFFISPEFKSDQTMFFSANEAAGGAFKSTDGGKTWESVTQGSALENLGNIQIAVSPSYPVDKTIVSGTDEGAYISKNGGDTWEELILKEGAEKINVEALAISPDYANDGTFLIYVKGLGLFETNDKGNTFGKIDEKNVSFMRENIPTGCPPIQFSPTYSRDETIYGYGAAGANIFKSEDNGKSWNVVSIPEREETFLDRIKDSIMWVKAWTPVLIWRTKVFFSKTQPKEEMLIGAGAIFLLFIITMVIRGMFKR